MKPKTKFKMKGLKEKKSNFTKGRTPGYTENILTPVALSGVVAPWKRSLSKDRASDYKLVSLSGQEYFIVADFDWQDVLSWYCWQEVKVIGLLNISNRTLIPQKVFPNGSTGEKENLIGLSASKSRAVIKKLIKNVNDLVVLPAAKCLAL